MNHQAPGGRRAPLLAGARCRRRTGNDRGVSAVELLLAVSLAATVASIAVPLTRQALDEMRTSLAARYLAGQLARARLEAVMQSRSIALLFIAGPIDDQVAMCADGNGNGVRNAEIAAGIDPRLTAPEALADKFPGVRFGLRPGVRDLDGALSGTAGIRFGTSRLASLSPDGTATSGTAYLHGTRSQYAVRVLGATGRVRVFRFDTGSGWIAH